MKLETVKLSLLTTFVFVLGLCAPTIVRAQDTKPIPESPRTESPRSDPPSPRGVA